MTALCVGGIDDHVHILLTVPPTIAISKAVQLLKGNSSNWIHKEFQLLKLFAWQDGYGAFTVSKSNLPAVIQYIERQREHHRRQNFQQEYRLLLKKHGVEYDEQYVWG